ncbi:hypothetical protein ATCC90586_000488 [Pythium insidiosum]|nr:hypothetical protein ATCC90586_000488 [Pythium insidiosum]
MIKYSRCGRRLVSISAEEPPTAESAADSPRVRRLSVWDMERQAPLSGCTSIAVMSDVAFVSFDPCNFDHLVLGGDGGLHVWKVYKGRSSFMLRQIVVKIKRWTTVAGGSSQPSLKADPMSSAAQLPALAEDADLEEKRQQFVCHAWMRAGRVLVGNRAGELILLDTTATSASSELVGLVVEAATRPNRCLISSVVYSAETIVVVYDDGHIAWLSSQEPEFELLESTALPCCSDASDAFADESGERLVASVAPSPTFSKVYVGTTHGHIYELRVSVAPDEELEAELDEELRGGTSNQSFGESDDPSSVATRLVSSCGVFHSGAVLSATALTPSGGTFANDLVVASAGHDGRVCLWSVAKRRLVAETNLLALFAKTLSSDSSDSTLAPDTGGNSSALLSARSPSLMNVAVSITSGAMATASSSDKSAGRDHVSNNAGPAGSVAIAALVSRPGDPLLLAGDERGKLRVLCVAKILGGSGAVECLPLHAVQLLATDYPLDVLVAHASQPVVLAASTRDRHVFAVLLDHERRFPVLAYLSLPDTDQVTDVRWSPSPQTPSGLSFTVLTTAGRVFVARVDDASPSDLENSSQAGPEQLRPRLVATAASELLPKCVSLLLLPSCPPNVLCSVSPTSNDLVALRYTTSASADPRDVTPPRLESKTLAPDAHDNGITAIALFGDLLRNGDALVATAGTNGVITLWTLSVRSSNSTGELSVGLDDLHAAKKKALAPHLGAVTSLSFFALAGGDEIFLLSTGADGCVCLLDVRVSADLLAAPPQRALAGGDPTMSPLYLNVANFAKYEAPFNPESELRPTATQPLLQVLQAEREEALRTRSDRLKDKTRSQLNELEIKLRVLLSENEKLPPGERLDRSEFVLNTAWRDQVLEANARRAALVREGIVRDIAKMSVVRERMKREFWDTASVPGLKLRGLSPVGVSPLFVYNFPMRRLAKDETLRMKKIELLRLVEYEHQRLEYATSSSTSSATASAARNARAPTPNETVWTRFHEAVPSTLQWLVGAGALHPSANRWLADKAAKDPAAPGAAASNLSSSPLVPPATRPSLNELQSFHLMYHPVAMRTRRQQRTQIQLLKSYVRALAVEFNREFQELARLKETRMEEIESKNARIAEICFELGQPTPPSDLFHPVWMPDEVAQSLLDVRPEEMTQTPYESEEARQRREREAAERAEAERQRQRDDVAGRALRDMMDGTLEVKKETLVNQTMVKEQWMIDTPVDEMTAEQKKLVAQFEAAQQKLKEEQDKYKKSLDLELKKIRSEILELCKAFDDKIRALQDVALGMKTSMLVQQLYQLRLAEELMEYEHLLGERQRLERELAAATQDVRACERENELFAAQLESCRDEWHRAVDEDKARDKAFLRDLEEIAAGHGVTIEHELVKHLVELFKRRKADDLKGGGVNAAAGSGPKRGKTNTSLGGGSKARLLMDANDASHRTLTAAAVLQNLQGGDASNGSGAGEGGGGGGGAGGGAGGPDGGLDGDLMLDPFQAVELPPRATSTAAASAGARQVAPLDYETDRPEGVMIDDRVWRGLNELRTHKILSELNVRERAEQLAQAKSVAEELRVKLLERQSVCDERYEQLQLVERRVTAVGENVPLLVHLKQGQDETSSTSLTSEDIFRAAGVGAAQDALLVARTSVEALNDVIQLHGRDQVGILGKIKNFRKNINVMEWEHTLLDLQTRDMEERYTDIQLLRVTKELQELFHTGDTTEKQKRELALLDAKLEHLGKHHQATLVKMEATQRQLEAQLRERMRENAAFHQQVQQLETQVQIREDILASRRSAGLRGAAPSPPKARGGAGSAAAPTAEPSGERATRLKAITVRRKLVDLAKAQTDEIEFLRLELDKMRRRTFPSFAAAVARGAGAGMHPQRRVGRTPLDLVTMRTRPGVHQQQEPPPAPLKRVRVLPVPAYRSRSRLRGLRASLLEAARVFAALLSSATAVIAVEWAMVFCISQGDVFAGATQTLTSYRGAASLWSALFCCPAIVVTRSTSLRRLHWLRGPQSPVFSVWRVARRAPVALAACVGALWGLMHGSSSWPSAVRRLKLEMYIGYVIFFSFGLLVDRATRRVFRTESAEGLARRPHAVHGRRAHRLAGGLARALPMLLLGVAPLAALHALSASSWAHEGANVVWMTVLSIAFKVLMQEAVRLLVLRSGLRDPRSIAVAVCTPTVLIDTQVRIMLLGFQRTNASVVGAAVMVGVELLARALRSAWVHRKLRRRQQAVVVDVLVFDVAQWAARVLQHHAIVVVADMLAEYIAIGCSAAVSVFLVHHRFYAFATTDGHAGLSPLFGLQLGLELVVDYVSCAVECVVGLDFEPFLRERGYFLALFSTMAFINVALSAVVHMQ